MSHDVKALRLVLRKSACSSGQLKEVPAVCVRVDREVRAAGLLNRQELLQRGLSATVGYFRQSSGNQGSSFKSSNGREGLAVARTVTYPFRFGRLNMKKLSSARQVTRHKVVIANNVLVVDVDGVGHQHDENTFLGVVASS